jgi:hypothetical protein
VNAELSASEGEGGDEDGGSVATDADFATARRVDERAGALPALTSAAEPVEAPVEDVAVRERVARAGPAADAGELAKKSVIFLLPLAASAVILVDLTILTLVSSTRGSKGRLRAKNACATPVLRSAHPP